MIPLGVYDNPYLPPFVAQRPRVEPVKSIQQAPQLQIPGSLTYSQIQPVNGFPGARAYADTLAAGSSAIISESDPSIARVYVVAKDLNNQIIVQGYRLTQEEEPKAVTLEDLNAKMNALLNRMDKYEEDQHAKPHTEPARKNNGSTPSAASKSSTTGNWGQQSSGGNNEDFAKRPTNQAGT